MGTHRLRTRAAAAYPALIAATYVLTKYLDEGLPLVIGIRAAMVAVLVALVVTLLAIVVLADLRRGALLGAILVGLLLTIHEPDMALVLAVLAVIVVAERLLASRTRLRDGLHIRLLHSALPVFSVLLLVVTVVQFSQRGGLLDVEPATAQAAPLADHPDIWIVLLDGYPRGDVLAEVYGWDNAPFVERLEDLGFHVSRHSRSNYLTTDQALPSMFNLSLLDTLPPFSRYTRPLAAPASDRWRALQHNRAFDILREHGYEVISFAGGYSRADLRAADRFIDAGTADLVELHLLADTAMRDVFDTLLPTFATGQIRSRIEHNLAGMGGLAREDAPAPRFVFVHVPAPHAPSVYGPDGSTLPARLHWLFHDTRPGGSPDDHRARYVGNLEHLNRLVLPAIEDLVTATGGEAAIVVMADHGSRSRGNIGSLTGADVHERFGTLFAAYTPGHPGLFGEVVTPVNVFAVLFDAYLGTSLPRHPDRLIDLSGREQPNPDEDATAAASARHASPREP
jgi:hypothetical protein